jgi:hypothetical protein
MRIFLVTVTLLLLSVARPVAASPASVPSLSDDWTICARQVVEVERILGLPPHLLQAISKVESGRWSKRHKALVSWPWTVMAEGRGRYLPSRLAAVHEVEKLRARGVSNIDVGCMQVNLHYHPKAFANLDQAFDPAFNVSYAGKFLLELRRETRSWERAIGRYPSATPKLANRYRAKVSKAWSKEKAAAGDLDARARFEANSRWVGKGAPSSGSQGSSIVFLKP